VTPVGTARTGTAGPARYRAVRMVRWPPRRWHRRGQHRHGVTLWRFGTLAHGAAV